MFTPSPDVLWRMVLTVLIAAVVVLLVDLLLRQIAAAGSAPSWCSCGLLFVLPWVSGR